MNYTEEQTKALKTDKHISVSANAGSGKTFVLVERYLKLLIEEGVQPDRILAITFTKKAAAEMNSRVVEKIEKILNDTAQQNKWEKMRKLRQKMTYSKISTIHSFCSQLLRDYPVESDVIPNFTELADTDISRITEEQIIATIEAFFNSDDKNEREMIEKLTDEFDFNTLKGHVSAVLSKSEIFEDLENIYTRPEFVDDQINKLAKRAEVLCLKVFDGLQTAFGEMRIIADSLGKYDELMDIAEAALDRISRILKSNINKQDIIDIAGIIESELRGNKILTSDYKISKGKFRVSEMREVIMEFEVYAELLKELTEIADVLDEKDNSELLFERAKMLFELAKAVKEEIDNEKLISGGLEFNDMIIKSRDLMRNEDIIGQIRAKYDYVMVDEFQDTNRIQYDIISSLIPGLNGGELKEGANLYIVGDPKQSIYRFRDADVRVFLKAMKDIRKLNEKTGHKQSGNINLTSTFRLDPVPASFVNTVCSEAFEYPKNDIDDYDKYEFEVDYEDLEIGKDVNRFDEYLKNNESGILDDKFGSVSFLAAVEEYDYDGSTDVESELLANKIIDWIENKYIYTSEGKRKLEFGDIAVLSRKRIKFNVLRAEFIKRNIPSIINSGSGFYETQEIMDFSAFVKFLQNNADDVSLITILRSHFFGLDDNELFAISRLSGNTFWDKFKSYVFRDGGEITANSKRAFDKLIHLNKYAARLSIPDLLNLIVETTAWFGAIAKDENFLRKKANYKKLINIATNFEGRGFTGLYDFAEELDKLAENSSEGEANYITDKNAVNIMTIHAAKGLQFPLIVLFDTNAGTGGNNFGFSVDKDHGINFKLNVYDNEGMPPEKQGSALSYIAEQKQKDADEAEEKRLLYVALTRAESHLVFSAKLKLNKLGEKFTYIKPFFKKIMAGAGFNAEKITPGDLEEEMLYPFHLKSLDNKLDFDGLKYRLDVVTDSDKKIYSGDTQTMPNGQEKEIYISEIKSINKDEIFSATKYLKYSGDKNAFTYRYELGIPDDDIIVPADDSREHIPSDEYTGTKAGTLIHLSLENLAKWMDINGTVQKASLENVIKNEMMRNQVNYDEGLFERIRDECLKTAGTELIRENAENIHSSSFEHEVYMPVAEEFIVGAIDLLFKNKNGEFEVWDWKSNIVRNIDELAEHYKFQMKLYAYFVYKLRPGQSIYSSKLLFTRLAEPDAEEKAWTYTFNWKPLDLEAFGNELEKITEKIKVNDLYNRYIKY